MERRPAIGVGIAGALVAMLLGASCAGEPPGAPGTAAQQESTNDWELFNIADTNGDGLDDVLWYSASTNLLAVWLMDGAQLLAPGRPIPGPPGTGWQPVTATDFNGDGLADVVWTNRAHGTMAVWLLNGAQLLAPGPVIAGPGPGWYVTAAGDTSGDGMADVAWINNATDHITVWLMDGAHVLARGPQLLGPDDSDHVLDDLADTNGDGMADVIWSHPAEDTMEVWLMNGARLLARRTDLPGPVGPGWSDVAVVDFNHDRLADVVATNAARGSMVVSLLNGAHLLAQGPEIPGPGDGWTLAYAGDTNGDGLADLAWQKKGTSQFTIWLMDGTRPIAQGPILPGPGELAAWP